MKGDGWYIPTFEINLASGLFPRPKLLDHYPNPSSSWQHLSIERFTALVIGFSGFTTITLVLKSERRQSPLTGTW